MKAEREREREAEREREIINTHVFNTSSEMLRTIISYTLVYQNSLNAKPIYQLNHNIFCIYIDKQMRLYALKQLSVVQS